jgi:hypothetical protein
MTCLNDLNSATSTNCPDVYAVANSYTSQRLTIVKLSKPAATLSKDGQGYLDTFVP